MKTINKDPKVFVGKGILYQILNSPIQYYEPTKIDWKKIMREIYGV